MPADFLDVIVDSEYESPVTDWVIAPSLPATRPATPTVPTR